MPQRMSSRMQALNRPGATSRSAGTSAAHASSAYGQRGAEDAARRRIDGTRDIAFEQAAVAARFRVRPRRRFEERFGIGMLGRPVQILRRRDFHHLAEIEHDDPIAQVFDDVEIVRDEQHGQPEALAQVGEQIDDLRLNGDVERGHRLVGDDELRLDGKRPGDADSLPLPAREFVRKTLRVLGRETHERQELRDPFPASGARCSPCVAIASSSVSPTRRRGLRLAYGSWKMICRRRR